MAFVKKTWKDRIAEFPTRRRLTKEDNTSELVTVAREEGTLSQEGDAFSAENMNDLENRIDAEFTEVNGNKLNKVKTIDFGLGIPTALSAGSFGYGRYNLKMNNIGIISIRIHTTDISTLNGLQLTPVYITSDEFYFTYYSPSSVSEETLDNAKWRLTYYEL